MREDLSIRLIATDVDGTMLDSRGMLTDENLRAIQNAQEKGITVAISSGRFAENVYVLLQKYGLSCPIIAMNGGKITDEKLQTHTVHFMDPEAVNAVYDTLARAGADFFVFARDGLATYRADRKHHSELSQGVLVRALGYGYHHGPEETFRCCQTPVFKFYICDNVPLAPLRQQLQSIPGIALTQSGENNIEVMPIGVDKGTGVRDMARMLGISMEQVMTLGDQENDIPMLMAAGYGVAMGNASDATKKVARYQTEDLDHGGFAKAIRRWALKEE